MSSRSRRAALALASLAAVTLLATAWRGTTTPANTAAAPASTPSTTPTEIPPGAASRRETYAIALDDLPGLPPGTDPGARITLWVTWTRPVTPGPRVQLLLRDVALSHIERPPASEGPPIAVLSIPARELSDVVYGDRFGDFAVTIPAVP